MCNALVSANGLKNEIHSCVVRALVSAINGLKNEIYSCVVRLFREESYNRKIRRIVPSRKIGESEESYLKTHFLLFSDLTIIAPF